jgi:hypothetical protein
MTPRKQSSSSWLSYLLMGGVLTFGAGAASLVLSDHASTGPTASAQKPVQAPRLPAPAASPVVAHPTQAHVAVKTVMPVTPPPSATPVVTSAPADSSAPAQTPHATPEPEVKQAVVSTKAVEVPVPVASVKSPVAQSAPTTPVVATKPAVPAPVAVPKAPVIEPKVAPKVVEVEQKPTPKVVPKAAEVEQKPVPKAVPKVVEAAPKQAPVSAKKATAIVAVKQERTPAAPRQAVPAPKLPVLAAQKSDMVAPPPLPPEMLTKGIPKMETSAAEQGPIIAEATPTRASASKAEPRASSQASEATALDAPRPVVKSVRAAPLVPSSSKPTVVMANGDKAWVKLDDQRTVIITKGQEVPGLGTFHGADKGAAKFDTGNVPLNQ